MTKEQKRIAIAWLSVEVQQLAECTEEKHTHIIPDAEALAELQAVRAALKALRKVKPTR